MTELLEAASEATGKTPAQLMAACISRSLEDVIRDEEARRAAAKAKLDVERQPVTPGNDNLIVRLTPLGQARHRIILAPHLDTVGGDSSKIFRPTKKGNKLHGRGACDTKGSVAAMFHALEIVTQRKQRPSETEIVFAGLMDEECNQTGSRALAKRRMKADLAIVGEPTRCKVVTAHKGDLWLRLTATGKAAHGARPELGRNAVHTLARCIDAIETDYADLLRQREDVERSSRCPHGRPTTLRLSIEDLEKQFGRR